MLTATLRAMIAHKLRLVLTTASIALGVAFLAGTLVLTDTMGLAFEQLFGKVSAGTDAVVRTHAPYTATDGVSTSRAPIPAAVLTDIDQVDGVRHAEGSVTGYALLTDNDGRAVLTNGGAPTMGYNMPADEDLRGDVDLLSGTAPDAPNEVAIDATSAEVAKALAVDAAEWREELPLIEEWFEFVGEKLPTGVRDEFEALKQRLSEAG